MKIVADTSVWINYFKGLESNETDLLDQSLSNDAVVLGDIVLMEILQGIKDENQFQKTKKYLEATEQVQMLNPNLAVEYAAYYRILRGKEITIRKSNDVIIAGYGIEQKLPLLQADRDFKPFAEHFGLELV